ncbi:MAG: hypothetical protein F4X60_17145 [Gemmatimonadetes bacterium]|nr:hypothetical protein [Gemmatimonadota bacterium]
MGRPADPGSDRVHPALGGYGCGRGGAGGGLDGVRGAARCLRPGRAHPAREPDGRDRRDDGGRGDGGGDLGHGQERGRVAVVRVDRAGGHGGRGVGVQDAAGGRAVSRCACGTVAAAQALKTGVGTAESPRPRRGGAKFWIGVDGGGTRSRALVGDREGRELGAADGGPGLIDPSDPLVAAFRVAAVAREAAQRARVRLPARALWAGLAGAGNESARAAVEKELKDKRLALRVVVGSDLEAAHADAFGEGPGVLLVAGTGSAVRAVDPRGEVVTVGGWGALLGDEGGGYGIGLEGIRAVLRAADGREPHTRLTDALLSETGAADARGLADWAVGASKGEIAALSVAVAKVSKTGDVVAARVVHRALGAVREHLEAVPGRTEGWVGRPPVAFVGGLVREGGVLREVVVEVAGEVGYAVRLEEVVPERGALGRAVGLGGD